MQHQPNPNPILIFPYLKHFAFVDTFQISSKIIPKTNRTADLFGVLWWTCRLSLLWVSNNSMASFSVYFDDRLLKSGIKEPLGPFPRSGLRLIWGNLFWVPVRWFLTVIAIFWMGNYKFCSVKSFPKNQNASHFLKNWSLELDLSLKWFSRFECALECALENGVLSWMNTAVLLNDLNDPNRLMMTSPSVIMAR